ncbi:MULTISPECIES: helix-turn-helix domain-containing protein [Enterococcus]|uniref:helix-turn-helix domain-containing protein n=1 Tax=Enterococcus TaxID=1350 RepID=UPI000BBB8EFE|nr:MULTISPECIES: helix-turn-helix transcriptional regulator [Enterococcus]MBD9711193.1 helix-turn-helix transcriptional regulator [Enterococcus faecium]MBD9713061.1 helix-turn-helix transcriptional regulator [Enterococcus faecium]MBD9715430.1 helix-turn-helix transcriptional regulator [Enterococcus faecium]MBD9737285.1 helix-turn-helix transcriptional regulator [Enterococcus faecium]MBD9747640.1 helix-turn-helix transcriptional regulator [Enterococcus faecium]
MKPNNIDVGKRIKYIRETLGMTLDTFGKGIGGTPKSTIATWESGRNLPNKKNMEKIAIIGNTTIEWIKWGNLEEYIVKFLESKGYISYISTFQETPHNIYLQLVENYSEHYQLDQDYELLDRFILSLFKKDYLPTFHDYVAKLVERNLAQSLNNKHSVTDQTFKNKFFSNLFELLLKEDIKYGDDKQIIKIATDLLQKMDEAYKVINKYSSVDDYFHTISENQFDIEKFLLDLSKRYNFPYEKNSKTAKILLDNHENFK